MEFIAEILKVTIPAGLVLYAMYLTVTAFLKKSFDEKQLDLKTQNQSVVLPIRLQAYERMCLFLERITPNNLLLRLGGQSASVIEFQQMLLSDLRDEFNHNLSQQVYMSHEAFEQVRKAQQDVITLINQAAGEVPTNAAPIELSKKIFEKIIQQNQNPTQEALHFLKTEIQAAFF
jgi:hypothetical protein